MKKIFAKSEEKYVQSIIVYGASGVLYMDEETTTKANPSIVKDLFIKHCLIIYDEDTSVFVYPVSMALDDEQLPTNVDAVFVDDGTVNSIQYTFE